MNVQRGDVLKARFPHASGGRGKKRPVVVVQSDFYNQQLRHTVVAEITGDLDRKGDPACLFINGTSADALAAGLTRDCLVSCYLITLMNEERRLERIGKLSDGLIAQLDDCLKAALSIR